MTRYTAVKDKKYKLKNIRNEKKRFDKENEDIKKAMKQIKIDIASIDKKEDGM